MTVEFLARPVFSISSHRSSALLGRTRLVVCSIFGDRIWKEGIELLRGFGGFLVCVFLQPGKAAKGENLD